MKKWNLVLFLIMLTSGNVLLCGCDNQIVRESAFRRSGTSAENKGSKKKITFACWNVQTFFDAVTSGTEYKEFKNSERWNKEKYERRLEKLCEVMTSLNPDIFVMEEIENEGVVQDIANRLNSGSWEKKKLWQYACFAKESESAIGCAVFSRYELSDMKVHSIDIRTQNEVQPLTRPLIQVSVSVGEHELELFVNHWKSKSGGEAETEIWRDWQEYVLAENLKFMESSEVSLEKPLIICGDFNRSAEDFITKIEKSKKSNTLLRGQGEPVKVCSPWFRPDGNFSIETGSYYYSGEWERIDNIMLSGNADFTSFSTVTDSPLADEEGIPLAYKIYTGEGCSDHLPLKCVIELF